MFLVYAYSKVTKKVYKNAFQWDAYRSLVDRIPACTARGDVYWGGVSARGVSAWGWSRVSALWGVSAEGYLPPPTVDRQTPVKT